MAISMDSDFIREKLSRLHTSAFGWAMVCCHNDQDLAAEVLQQTYCRILSGKAKYAGKSEFSTWVFGVIRHVAYEEYRRQRKHFQHATPFTANALASEEYDHVTLEQQELADQLQAALMKLSDRQREILHLTFYEDKTLEQAADILEISVGSARQHYQRGKTSLQCILSQHRELEP